MPRGTRRIAERGRIGPFPVWAVVALAAVVLIGGGVAFAVAGSGSDSPVAKPPPGAAPGGSVQGSAPPGTPAAAAGCAEKLVGQLPIEEQAAQLLMIGTPLSAPLNATSTIQKYKIGGVFLAGRSSASAASLKQQIGQLQEAARSSLGIGLQIGIDQEGGQVQTLKGADFPAIPTAVNQGKLEKTELGDRTAEWARLLKGIGITIDLAPVADVVPTDVGKNNPPIGGFERQYGATPDPVAEDVVTVVQAIQGVGVLTTLKHFPGLGRVRLNTDTSTGAQDPLTTADDPILKPFASGIAAGSAAVMISSAAYPKLDPKNVAAFSQPIVTGLLREKMGFTGLVLSDDLGSAVAVSSTPVGQRAVKFIQAGGDMALSVRLSDAAPMTEALVAAAKADPAFAARVKQSAIRVMESKLRATVAQCR
ncbi:glycoside hydrolase family 3 N-terminal domain-containing protein [Dactylosporangium matsuzakiense]|uniref:beta-N-acetylhexosaminidase n=1 Tax=Dactylosporangium matsuzakiense TaxID=53360 RepID=A0A9W6KPB2_9ACTN|nr:glycoside hydrolase family 3 N-terminal domain-containing protein [Dactylosporangium matsuzakiense]UWZ42893.1 glycoside hydrolase family 3 protein [Dactylosporangium matsuzakiense]GLL03981.1 beta-N-acetylhexosaminidase [Dactylosporangium matsuzakiense]